MKKSIFIFLLLFIISSSLKAQYSTSDIEKSKADIKLLENKWDRAVEKRDSLTLEKILAPKYSLYYTNAFSDPPQGDQTFRKEWLYNTLHRVVTDTLEVIGEQKITFFGMAATCEQHYKWIGHWINDSKFIYESDITDMWIKTKDSWQALYRMGHTTKTQDDVK